MTTMRKAAAWLALLLCACASSSPTSDTDKKITTEIVQLTGPSDVGARGEFDVQYGVRVENHASEPVLLRRIEVRQVGTGAYVLTRQNEAVNVSREIAVGTAQELGFWMHAYARVLPGTFGSSEPVSVRASFYFEAKSGNFRTVVHKTFSQFNN